jgi:thymidylate synthase
VRPEIQKIHNDGIHAKRDFICTFCTHHFIRNDRLEYIVYMRSNDIEFGLPYDLAWHQYVYQNMLNDIVLHYPEVKAGRIYWHASSLHLYERESKAGGSLA